MLSVSFTAVNSKIFGLVRSLMEFDALIALRHIEITRDGYYDKIKMEGSLTCFVARDELLERLQNLEGHPAISL